jgi:hypothetical protein
VFASVNALDRFDLEGSLSVGGINAKMDSAAALSSSSPISSLPSLPREVWSGMLGDGYVGCLLDMVMDGNKIDLVTAAQIQVSQITVCFLHIYRFFFTIMRPSACT